MFTIRGKVNTTDVEAAVGLTILALDTFDGAPTVAATATTAEDGAYSLVLELGDVLKLFRGDPSTETRVLERAATLHVSALRGGMTLARRDVAFTIRDLLDGIRCIDFSVDLGRSEQGRPSHTTSGRRACRYLVRGHLFDDDGTPLPSTRVEVVEKRLRSEVILGETATDSEGSYSVMYSGPAPCDPARPRKSLFARAFDPNSREIARSRLHCDVPNDVTIDLVMGEPEAGVRRPSLYIQVRQAVEPHLEEAKLNELDADEVEFLACTSRESVVQIAYLVRAAQLEQAVGATQVAFFALFNAGLPTTLVGILGQDRETLESALRQGDTDNVVPPWREGQIDSILDSLHKAQVELSVPEADPEASLLGQLFLMGGVARSLPRQFIEGWLSRSGTVSEFWTDFRAEHGKTVAERVQFSLAIGSLTGNHIPLVEVLQAKRNSEEIKRARDLARLTVADWLDVLTTGAEPPGAPSATPGETPGEKNERYAATLQRIFEDAFPTMAVAGALARAQTLENVDEFVKLNETFDFGRTRIDAFLKESPNLPSGDLEKLRRDLKHVQRLHAIAPRFARGGAVTALLGKNVVSAQQIYKMGYAGFMQKFEGVLEEADRELVWRKAAQQSYKVLATAANYAVPFNAPRLAVLPYVVGDPNEDGFPNIEMLFGTQDFCACNHCRSVFGPAAYLTDLLKFLRDQPAAPEGPFGEETLLDVIKDRRPDLVHVLLNCDNANISLPTIDLVNELLERRVSPPQNSDWEELQTKWTTQELPAHPEHLHQPAYDLLRDALHPFILPFDLRLEEARLYLDHLGVRLADLLYAFKGHSDQPQDLQALARETLRLSRMQGEIIEDDFSDTPPAPGDLWGLGGSWVSELNANQSPVLRFLKHANLTYQELLELLQVDYVCLPAGMVEIEHAEGKPCTLEDAVFGPSEPSPGGWAQHGLGETRLGRAQRFVRLARRTGWGFLDLDAAVRALSTVSNPYQEDALSGAWVRRFAGVSRLLERWPRLPKLEVLSWFGLVDTRRGPEGKPSFYERLFLDRTLDPENESFALADPDPGDPPDDPPTLPELANTGPLGLAMDGPVLQAALNLQEAEIKALLEALVAFAEQVPQRNLTWLSRLHRRASLARALGMPVLDLMRLASLMGMEPFRDGVAPEPDVEHTRKFIERVERMRATRFTLAELDYLLRHRFEPSEGVALLRDRAQEIFVELIRGLQDIEAETSRQADAATPPLTIMGDRLGQVIDEIFTKATLQLVRREDLVVDEAALRTELEKVLSEQDIDRLFEEDSQGQPVQDGRTVEERAEDTLTLVLKHSRSTQMQALVIQKLSDAVGLESGAGEALLREMEVNGEDGVTLFLRNAFVHAIDLEKDAEAIKKDGFPALDPETALDEHFETLERLHKASIVVQRFGFRVHTIEWLLGHADALELLDPLGLPPAEMDTAAAHRFERWEKLARVVLLRETVFRDPDALFDLLSTADNENGHLNENGQVLLVEGTGWDAADLKHLVEHEEDSLGINAASIGAIDGLERLARAFAVLRRLGVSADRATGWATTDVAPEVAQAIKNTTRSKHAPEQWPQVIGPLRDGLREQQRDALVAQVLAQSPNLRAPDDLLGELLIDVQGAACQRTTRIVQASATVQLFVQRLLMDLEAPERLDDRAAREWVWRKSYRVWEANRKVFLYPENFVEPELRDDQSPFFRELAADLMDADLTPKRAERAYIQYLRKVRGVARLEAAGIFHEVEYGYRASEMMPYQVINDLHVFARTMSPPYRYFYRKWVKETYWTAWEEVPLGIEHPTVMPAVHHRRLLLMWPVLREVAEGKKGSDKPIRYLEIQLAFSEYVDGSWTQTQISEDKTSTVRPVFEITTGPSETLRAVGTTKYPQAVFFETLVGELDLLVQPMFVAWRLEHDPTGGSVGSASSYSYVSTPQAFHFVGAENKVHTLDAEDDIRPTNWPSAHPRPNKSSIRYQYYVLRRGDFNQNESSRAFTLFRPEYFDTKGADVVATPRLLRAASPFKVLAPMHNVQPFPFGTERTPGRRVRFLADDPFFYHDDRRTFFVWPRDPNEIGLPSFEGDDADLSDLNGNNIGLFVPNPGNPVWANPTTAAGGVLDDTPDRGAEHDYAASQARSKRFWFFSFQHPFITRMLGIVEREGVGGLLDPAEDGDNADLRRQLKSELVMRQVPGEYEPNNEIVKVVARDEFEFEPWGAYALYNWEIFFHAPLLVAQRLRDAHRFEDAQRWYHAVFDPTESSSDNAVERFWKVKPLYEAARPKAITEQLEALNYTGGDPEKQLLRHTTEGQIAQWQENPFNPHLLARLRPAAYQRATVMKYLDNLIAWGDDLFLQATRGTIAEALQIYVLALQILGPRPLQLNARTPDDRSFDDLEEHLDAFSNALVELENIVPPGNQWDWLGLDGKLLTPKIQNGVQQPGGGIVLNFAVPPPQAPLDKLKALGSGGVQPDVLLTNLAFIVGGIEPEPEPKRALYYCVPPNDKLLAYWDTVGDRLFKIRNCLNIEGVQLELPLFEPPIDPALLVKATAAGIDLASAIAALNAPRPHYRFRTTIPVAKELAAEVRALGQALLSALESKDEGQLAELRSTHEVRTVEAAERVLEDRISEARQNIIALKAARAAVKHREEHYTTLLQEPVIKAEVQGLDLLTSNISSLVSAIDKERLAADKGQIPDFGISIGYPGGVSLSTTIGGSLLSIQHASEARTSAHDAARFGTRSSSLLTTAGIEVRQKQWELEFGQAGKEIDRIDEEITAAEIRVELALKELDNHRKEITQAREREDFLKNRFTRSELYGWMASEVGRVYHQAYQLAYDMAKRAERTYQFELAAEDTSFIQFGYWDNQRKGLLAGDKLLHDIRRMETAYLQSHRREFELTKSVSLATLDPVAMVLLRETGECYLRVPELLFDLDHPGHFLRRLRSVSVSVASKTGQLAEVPLTLTLVSSAIRKSASTDAEALVDDLTSGIQQIATLSAEEDDGLFERNFNDERYMPFEGRGAVGLWHIELPKAYRQFDYAHIGDVVLRLSFTARQGGDAFKVAVLEGIDSAIKAYVRHESSFGQGLTNAVSVRKVFPDDWNRFIDPAGEEAPTLQLDFSPERFPLRFQRGEIRVSTLWLLAVFKDETSTQTLAFDLELPSTTDATMTIQDLQLASPLSVDAARIRMGQAAPNPQPTTGAWTIELLGVTEAPVTLEDLVVVLQYTVLEPT